jgi:hypothetical protein
MRQSLAISCCGYGSRVIFRNIAFGYTAPTKKTAAVNSGMTSLRIHLVLAAGIIVPNPPLPRASLLAHSDCFRKI